MCGTQRVRVVRAIELAGAQIVTNVKKNAPPSTATKTEK